MVLIFGVFFLLAALMGLYFFFFLRRALRAWGISASSRWVKAVLILISLLLTLSITQLRSIFTLFVLHVFFLGMLFDLLHLPFRAFRKLQRVYLSGLLPIALSVFALVFGYFHMQTVQPAYYSIETENVSMRIAFLSDLHYPNAMTPERLQSICDKIEAQKPDLLLLGGDMVDEGTSDAEIGECISILDSISSTYGTYYICGNHDNLLQRYSNADLLYKALESSEITLLADETAMVGGLTLVGRRDLSDPSRRPLSELLPQESGYVLCLDHQPLDAEAAAADGCDLMLSGHTHNGQIWPIGYINALLGPKYGQYQFGEMDLVVSSGIVGWAYPIRTQGVCEYVILDLTTTK